MNVTTEELAACRKHYSVVFFTLMRDGRHMVEERVARWYPDTASADLSARRRAKVLAKNLGLPALRYALECAADNE
jgi:hypothetical protein